MPHYPDSDPESRPTLRRLRERFPDRVVEASDHRGDLAIRLKAEGLLEVLAFLRDDPETGYDLMLDICGVDWPGREPRFEGVSD